MKDLRNTALRRRRARARAWEILRSTLYIKLGMALALGFAVGLLILRLSAGPLSFAGLSERVAWAIASRIGPGWEVTLRTSALQLEDGSLALRTSGLDIRNPDGVVVVRAPEAIISVETFGLLRGSLQPRLIEFRDLEVRAAMNADGSLSFVAADGSEPQAVTVPPELNGASPPDVVPSAPREASHVSAALASLFDLILEPRGIVGALDRARVSNARFTLVGSDRRPLATFEDVNASFERTAADGRRFALKLDGPRGPWRLHGELSARGEERSGIITATEVPADDWLLFSAGRAIGSADLRLSGEIRATLAGGRVAELEAHLSTGGGVIRINDEDMPAIVVEAAAIRGRWDESRRLFNLEDVAFRAGETDLRLRGEFALGDGPGWRLRLEGQDARLSGTEPGDQPIVIQKVEAAASGGADHAALERLILQGPGLDVSLSAAFGAPTDPKALQVKGQVRRTAVRTALRLWPNPVVPKVRRYLVPHLRAGVIDALDLAIAMSGDDLAKANADGPLPEHAVNVTFTIIEGELAVADGLPPLSSLKVSGTVTGTAARVHTSSGQVRTPDGRALAVSEGRFTVADIWADGTLARIGLKLDGGADALGALLQTPLLKRVASLDFDPAALKGRAELRIGLDLLLDDVPMFEDLPLTIAGAINGLSIDKVFGKERLENASLTVSFEQGHLAIRGEGRLWGVPASIDVRQPKAGPGEALVLFTLDEPARVRKGMSFGSQLSGPVAVRVTLPLGKEPKGTRVEADLTRAQIDHLVPGWTKAPGRPGKLSFVLQDGSTELRDFAVDSGPVHMNGTLVLSPDGQLDKVDLGSFRLSQGDDMRLQLERQGGVYRVSVRGQVTDARPFIRKVTTPTGSAGAKDRDGRDVELDFQTSILSGFNDEALTQVSLKASWRGQDLKQLQFSGRLRSAVVSGQLARFDRGTPVLVVESADAGGTLRFLDLYRRMQGGQMGFQITLGEGPQRGVLNVHSFSLRDEPALKRIAAQAPQTAMAEDRAMAPPPLRLDSQEVQFTRLRAEFGRTGNRIEIRDAAIWGPQVGFKLTGWIDYGRDQVDVAGTFVPAYGLNNAFAQVPLFGPILGGGQNEGLFAVNFRVTGPASAPSLSVNPFSAVAPGFLRKLFGAGSPDMSITGAPAPPRPSER